MELKDIAGIAITFVIVAIVISIGGSVITSTRGTHVHSNDSIDNISIYAGRGLESLGSWLPTIAIVVVAAIVIGIIVTYFAMK